MATEKSVKLRIVADAGTAKETLDSIAEKTDALDGKKSSLRVNVQSGTTKADLDEISAKADALGIKNVTFTVKADTKPARVELDALKLKTDMLGGDLSGPGGLLGKLGQLFNMGGSSAGEAGSLAGEAGSAGGALGGATLPAIAAMIPVVGAVAVEVTGLVSGFAAAGAGAGAFALLAMPAVKTVMGALKDTKAQLAQLSPDERGAVEGIKGLETEFGKLSTAFQPMVFKVFNDALKVANNLLPYLTPLANAFANALSGLLQRLDKFTQSEGFQQWAQKFTSLVGPAVTAIGNGIGKLVPALGQLLTLLSKKDVVNAINIAFSILTTTVKILTSGISMFMRNYDSFTSTVSRDSHDIGNAFKSIATAVSNMVSVATIFIGNLIRFVASIPGRIIGALSGLGSAMFNIGYNAMVGLWNGFISLYDRLVGWIENNLFGGIIGKALHVLGMNSPSKVFADMGSGIVEGLVLGMDRDSHKAVGSVANLAKSVSDGFNPSLNVGASSVGTRGSVTNNFTVNVSGIVGDAGATGREIVKAANEYLRQTGQPALVGGV